ncbi:DUF3575 domain-containing protein [Ferruginibacter sp. SUN002]|uniref:DUF3575 domain-containing protein n=1 Tax=Ferruginibacter sp. SUN002 TaxID=2937789 RepID=UPI003D362C58
MHFTKVVVTIILFSIFCLTAQGQVKLFSSDLLLSGLHGKQGEKITKEGFVVKTNLLNLIMRYPAISVEKMFNENNSIELSIVKGRAKDFIFTDYYEYQGALIALRHYFDIPRTNKTNFYGGGYMGSFKRIIQTTGTTFGSGGYLGYPSRDFEGHSLRVGGSLGAAYFFGNKIVIDAKLGLGYGVYYSTFDKIASEKNNIGHLDAQIWLSVGYKFKN